MSPTPVAAGAERWGEWMIATRVPGEQLSRAWGSLRTGRSGGARSSSWPTSSAPSTPCRPRASNRSPTAPTRSRRSGSSKRSCAPDACPGVDQAVVAAATERVVKLGPVLDDRRRHHGPRRSAPRERADGHRRPAHRPASISSGRRAGSPDLDLDILLHSFADPSLHVESGDHAASCSGAISTRWSGGCAAPTRSCSPTPDWPNGCGSTGSPMRSARCCANRRRSASPRRPSRPPPLPAHPAPARRPQRARLVPRLSAAPTARTPGDTRARAQRLPSDHKPGEGGGRGSDRVSVVQGAEPARPHAPARPAARRSTPSNLVTDSGWREAPRLRDMTEFRFCNSTCQVEGEIVPVAEMNLAEGDAVFFEHHVMLWKEESVPLSTQPTGGGRQADARRDADRDHRGPRSRADRLLPRRHRRGRRAPAAPVDGARRPRPRLPRRPRTRSPTPSYSIKGLANVLHGGEGMYMDRFVTAGEPGHPPAARLRQRVRAHARGRGEDPRRAGRLPLQGLVGRR